MAESSSKEKQDAVDDTGSYWEYDDQFEDFEGASVSVKNAPQQGLQCYLELPVSDAESVDSLHFANHGYCCSILTTRLT